MTMTRFTTRKGLHVLGCQALLSADPIHPHIHRIDMPFRETSTWQDQGCEWGVWAKDARMLAWAVFLPIWRNIDYAIIPSERGSSLEQEVLAWGKEQMTSYAARIGTPFYGSVELYEDTPLRARIEAILQALGFDSIDPGTIEREKLHASTIRFEIDSQQTFQPYQLPDGYRLRPLSGKPDVQASIHLMNAVFGPDWMTEAWRLRTLADPAYAPEIDLVVENPEKRLVGFCSCWLWNNLGQIEPLGVHPDYQRMGIGKALERAACEVLQRRGAHCLQVDHGSSNDKAIALSRKTGFRHMNTALKYYIQTGNTDTRKA